MVDSVNSDSAVCGGTRHHDSWSAWILEKGFSRSKGHYLMVGALVASTQLEAAGPCRQLDPKLTNEIESHVRRDDHRPRRLAVLQQLRLIHKLLK